VALEQWSSTDREHLLPLLLPLLLSVAILMSLFRFKQLQLSVTQAHFYEHGDLTAFFS
jgi:hypothetical protein